MATATVSLGLLPFALAMGVELLSRARWIFGNVGAGLVAGFVLGVTLACWYGWELIARRRKQRHSLRLYDMIDPLWKTDMNEEQQTNLSTRVKQVFIECRVVLPGAQALLGFQLIIMWMTAFYKIPRVWKLLHLASLISVAICTILLIMPAAYHRIVEEGEDSEMLHHITERALLSAMVFLALGICGDFYVVTRMTDIARAAGIALTLGLLTFFLGAWFGYSLWKKHRVHDPSLTRSHLKEHKAA